MLFQLARVISACVKMMFSHAKLLLFLSITMVLHYAMGFVLLSSASIAVAVYIATGGWRVVRLLVKTCPRDCRAAIYLLRLKARLWLYTRRHEGIPTLFKRVCDRLPNKVCFIFEGQEYSYKQVDDYSNTVANFFLSEGFSDGDAVAFFMESSAEYVCIWLGLAKIGVIPALINYNLRLDGLCHCVQVANAKAIIYSPELRCAVEEARGLVNLKMKIYYTGQENTSSPGVSLSTSLRLMSNRRPAPRRYNFNGPLIYIYTSGTTGLPKAAKVVHSRYYYLAGTVHMMLKFTDDDIIYDTLPLYHTAGGILGIGQALLFGNTVVIRKKFSASAFWTDCRKYNCTIVQYIGEICRYLLAQPVRPEDRQHRVHLAFGNGIKPQIWKEFQQRYGIHQIGEFYGATEGNASAINIDNTVGAVGFTSVLAPSFHPISVICVDHRTGNHLRGSDGLCIRAKPGQPGELIGMINQRDPLKRFDGYSSQAATEKKIIRDVFSKGDMYFLTGDILVMDELGYLYFRDRTGDTFRWKGENVSTADVEAVVSNVLSKRDATAYGVEIAGLEGRAGMVAVADPDGSIDVSSLCSLLKPSLPAYAIPIFVRLMDNVETTGTFKLKKVELRDEGFNPSTVKDRLFYLDNALGSYKLLTVEVYTDIVSHKLRL